MVKNFIDFIKTNKDKYGFGFRMYRMISFKGTELKLRNYVRYRCILKNILNISINRVSFDKFLVLRHPVPSRRKTWTPSLNCMTRWGCETVNNDAKMLWSIESSYTAKLPTLAPSLFCMIRWCETVNWRHISCMINWSCETGNIGAIFVLYDQLSQHWRHLCCMINWCCETGNIGAIFVLYDQVMLRNWKHWRCPASQVKKT